MDHYLRNILRFNEQLAPRGLRSENLQQLGGSRPDAVVVVGMGGSGLAGEIVAAARKDLGLRVPVFIWKDYALPELPGVFRRPLYVFISFSGNTEETLSGFTRALKFKVQSSKFKIGVIATGGELLGIARRKKLPLVAFPSGDLTPRQGTGRIFYAIIEILFAAGLIRERPPAYDRMKPVAWKKKGYALARRLRRKLILIYTQSADWHLGYFWKIKFNETAKAPAFNNVLPEMNHNELVGLQNNPFPTAALMIKNRPNRRLAKRMTINKKLLRGSRVDAIEIAAAGKNALEQAWNTIMFADWTSYALAKMNGVDPRKTKVIDDLKTALKK